MNELTGLLFWMPMILAMAVSFVSTKWVIKNASSWGIIDDPKKHLLPKVSHDYPVPRGGGIPIYVALLTGLLLFLPKNEKTWGILAGATIIVLTGWIDDKYEEKVSPYLRLGLNILAALLVIGAGVGIAYISNPMGGIINLDQPQICFQALGGSHCIWILSDLFALVWLVWMQNVVGWSSGVDGQLPGFVVIAAITMGILGLRFGQDSSQWIVITLAAITAGAYAGFLPWNFWPQKIMPGYGGKSLAGFLLGVLAILSSAKVGALLLVLGIPFVDAVLVIIKRIREGRSPVWGGREHLHHYLLDMGWSKRKIALFYWLVSAILAIAAWQLKAPAKFYTMAAVILIVGGLIFWLHNWSTYLKQRGHASG
jgi:UDP-GlcNAc:undecaprenyl-phosphate GlcNAc-1-phosphate transferase